MTKKTWSPCAHDVFEGCRYCFDGDFYNISRDILKFEDLNLMSSQLLTRDKNPYYGKPQCIKLFRH